MATVQVVWSMVKNAVRIAILHVASCAVHFKRTILYQGH
jgi:hypothetical protein